MNILLIITVIGWVIAVAIPIVGTYKSYKKLKNTRKKLKEHQQEQRKKYEQYQLDLKINELMFQEANKTKPDINTMKKIVEHKSNSISFSFRLAYELKLKSEEKKLTTLEATMSPLQLYKAGNPLWAKPFTPKQIQIILTHQNSPNFDKIFQSQLER